MSQKYLIGNWKMNLNHEQSLDLVFKLKNRLKKISQVEVIIAPSFLYLKEIKELLGKSHIKLASQTVAPQSKGAYTGEISAGMLKEVGVDYVIVGHSERRQCCNETDQMINKKLNQCFHNGLTPILCIGETLEQRREKLTESVIVKQLQKALSKVDSLPENEILICYEPVWAVGTGEFLDPGQLSLFQRIIKRTISGLYSEKFYNQNVKLLYGGSVNSIVAKDYWISDLVSGLLVGGASLDPEQFYNIAVESEG